MKRRITAATVTSVGLVTLSAFMTPAAAAWSWFDQRAIGCWFLTTC